MYYMTNSSFNDIDFTQYPQQWGERIRSLSSEVEACSAQDSVPPTIVDRIQEDVNAIVEIANIVNRSDPLTDIADVTVKVLVGLMKRMPLPSEDDTADESCKDTKVRVWKILVDGQYFAGTPSEPDQRELERMATHQKLDRVMQYLTNDRAPIVPMKDCIATYNEDKTSQNALALLYAIGASLKNVAHILAIEGLDYADRSTLRNFLIRLRPFIISDDEYLVAEDCVKSCLPIQ